MGIPNAIITFLRALFRNRAELAVENLALRQPRAVLQRSVKGPRLRRRDRIFWMCVLRIWSRWKSALIIVQPETVIRWHRQGFTLYWRWKSRRRRNGRPRVDPEIRHVIRRISGDNPTWGVPRIQSELVLRGDDVADSTVAKYVGRTRRPPSQTWRTFLRTHATELVAMDFFTVPTATCRVLSCFVVLRHDRRRVAHVTVTDSPSASWTAQQMIEAFPFNEAPRVLLRDNDQIYGDAFTRRGEKMDIDEVVTAPRSPWQNPYAEWMIGTLRRECVDHVIVLGAEHLRGIVGRFLDSYHRDRTHQGLERNSPEPREIERPSKGRVIALPRVGGLHHRYTRVA